MILDVKNYNFDDQSGTVLKTPVKVQAGDTIRVTCTFDPTIRQKLPELKICRPVTSPGVKARQTKCALELSQQQSKNSP